MTKMAATYVHIWARQKNCRGSCAGHTWFGWGLMAGGLIPFSIAGFGAGVKEGSPWLF